MSDDLTPVALGPVALARWMWRQLTSMRTALILLLLLAIASIPGSLIPQDGLDPNKSALWRTSHPHLTPIYRRLDLFSVYSAPWFAAIYVLLMLSLVGCIIPRLFVYARALRAQPPRTPKNLGRFADTIAYVSDDSPEVVLDRAAARLSRYRLRRDDPTSISAEKGYLREAGNLVFHLSIIVVLVGFATGQLFGYKGAVQVVVGHQYNLAFSNQLIDYDDFSHGSMWTSSMLNPFTLRLDSFTMDWSRGSMGGDFDTTGTYDIPGQPSQRFDLKVNHPLTIGSTNIFLIGHGYAPIITLRDSHGAVISTGPTPFLPVDAANFQSVGALRSLITQTSGPSAGSALPIGLECTFLPVASADEISSLSGDLTLGGSIRRGSSSLLSCFVYKGNLGNSTAFTIDSSNATKVTGPGGRAFNLVLDKSVKLRNGTVLHNTIKLPQGLGTLSFDGIAEWNRLQISQQPGREVALGGVMLALFGLMGSLFIRPRRVWVRATSTPGGTLVEIAALDRTGGGDIAAHVAALKDKLTTKEHDDV